ncbi:hypothetical protein EVA_13731, partial [gut metagenome]
QLSAEEPLLHVRGVPSCRTPPPRTDPLWLERVDREGKVCDVQAFYRALAAIGLGYQGAFKPIQAAWTFAGEDGLVSDVLVELASQDAVADMGMGLSPAMMDGALQGLFFALAERLGQEAGREPSSYLPSWFGKTIVWSQGTPAWAEISLLHVTERSAKARILVRNAEGKPLVRFEDVRFLRVHHQSKAIEPAFYTERWYKAAAERRALTQASDVEALQRAVRAATTAYEWSSERAVETEELLHWLVMAYVREAVRVYDEWQPEELLFTEGW